MSQTVDLDTTLAALQGDLKSIPTDEALAIIDTWYQQFKDTALGEDLRQVKEAIENRDRTGISLGETLIALGTNTTASSSDVVDDEVTAAKLQDIGILLTEAGNSLKK